VLTAEEARAEAKKWLADRAKGNDPIAELAASRKSETVEQLCRSYLAAAKQGLILGKRNRPKKASTLATDRGRVERHILPLLGKKRVRDITNADVNRFMRGVMAGKTVADVKTGFRGRAIVEGGAGTAARTVGLLGGIFSYAVSEGLRPDNPVRGVKRPADNKRDRRLSSENYRALGDALAEAEAEGENPAAVAAVRLLALTGARLGEIANLRSAEIDRHGRALRLADTKEGASVRPLGAAALGLLDGLPAGSIAVRRESLYLARGAGRPPVWRAREGHSTDHGAARRTRRDHVAYSKTFLRVRRGRARIHRGNRSGSARPAIG